MNNPVATETQFSVKIALLNGTFATNKNAHRIRCEKVEVGCPNVIHHAIDPKTYREVYRIKKDHWDEWKDGQRTGRKRKGYCFVEITHGMGGPGHTQNSVGALIKAAAVQNETFFGGKYRIIFEGGSN